MLCISSCEFRIFCYLECNFPHPIKTEKKNRWPKKTYFWNLRFSHIQLNLIILGVDRRSLSFCTSQTFCQWSIVRVDFLSDHILSYGGEACYWSKMKILFFVCSLWRYRKTNKQTNCSTSRYQLRVHRTYVGNYLMNLGN